MTNVTDGDAPQGDDPRLIVFFIPLLVPLGLPHGSTFTTLREGTVDWLAGVEVRVVPELPPVPASMVGEEGKNFVSLRVWRPRETLPLPHGPLDSATQVMHAVMGAAAGNNSPAGVEADRAGRAEEIGGTVIEAVTPLLDAPGQDAVTLAFDRCQEELALLVRAYALVSSEPRVRLVTRQTLFPMILHATRRPHDSDWEGPHLLMLHPWVGFLAAPQELDAERLERLGLYLGLLRKHNPFLPFAEWARSAGQAFHVDGDYAAAVVVAHTAGEVLFDTVLLVMAWEERTPRAEAEGWFEDALARRLRRRYAPRLGDVWDTTNPRTVPGRWTTSVSAVRNRVVHAGYRPTDAQVATALAVLGEVEGFIKDRLVAKRAEYPRTALLLLGRPGLERRGAYAGAIEHFVNTIVDTEDDWNDSYRRWLSGN